MVTAQIRKTLTDAKPLYAVAGAGDLAVEKLRHGLTALRGDLREEPKATRARAGALRQDVTQLTHKTEVFAHGQLDKAAETYDDLAGRGERLMGRIRRQKATDELVEQAEATIRRARATRTAAHKGAQRAGRAAQDTMTEARKTAQAAATAGRRAAQKVGN